MKNKKQKQFPKFYSCRKEWKAYRAYKKLNALHDFRVKAVIVN